VTNGGGGRRHLGVPEEHRCAHGGQPDDEFRYELDDGVLIVSPAPSTLHQLAVARLTVQGAGLGGGACWRS
jgi:hypothetical protein